MKVMKINNLNTIVKEGGDLEGADFANYVLNRIGVKVQFDDTELLNIPGEGAFIVIGSVCSHGAYFLSSFSYH